MTNNRRRKQSECLRPNRIAPGAKRFRFNGHVCPVPQGLERICTLVNALIDDYIATQDVIVYASAKDCSYVQRATAFALIQDYQLNDAHAAVQVVASDFSGRILIEPIGVGVGEQRKRRS